MRSSVRMSAIHPGERAEATMQGNAHGTRRHLEPRCSLADRRALDRDRPHDHPLTLWKTIQATLDIARRQRWRIVLSAERFGNSIDRHAARGRTAQCIDELVSRDGIDPRRYRMRSIPGVSLQ